MVAPPALRHLLSPARLPKLALAQRCGILKIILTFPTNSIMMPA
jgi:hypothetical protein